MAKGVRAVARQEFWKMAEQAKADGKDLAEVLDRCGVLLTPERKAAIEAEVYRSLVLELQSSSANDWTDADNKLRSPNDMKNALTRRLQLFADAYERKANGL